MLFDKYLPTLQDGIKKKFKKITPIPVINHIQVLCNYLSALIIPANVPPDAPKELYELFFVFACVWAYGSSLFHDGQTDYRADFSKWFIHEFKSVKFPLGMNVFDVWVEPTAAELLSWNEKVPKFELDVDLPLQACLVHNAETIRIRYFIDILIGLKFPVMLIGTAGSGKTLLIGEKLGQMDEEFIIANVPFNFYYTAELTQKILEKPLEKKAGKNYGPPGSQKLIYFLGMFKIFSFLSKYFFLSVPNIELSYSRRHEHAGGGQVRDCGSPHSDQATHGLRSLVRQDETLTERHPQRPVHRLYEPHSGQLHNKPQTAETFRHFLRDDPGA